MKTTADAPPRDETGHVYEHWTVLRKMPNDAFGNAVWLCRCRCGVHRELLGLRLAAPPACSSCQRGVIR